MLSSNGLNVKPRIGETYNIFASPEVEDLATRFDLVSLPGLDDGHVFRLQYGRIPSDRVATTPSSLWWSRRSTVSWASRIPIPTTM